MAKELNNKSIELQELTKERTSDNNTIQTVHSLLPGQSVKIIVHPMEIFMNVEILLLRAKAITKQFTN